MKYNPFTNTKYHNKKVTVNGETFDSEHEYERWCELKLLERVGEISNLKYQVRFDLLPSQYLGKKCLERGVAYIADFVYRDKGDNQVVEDAKGAKTKDYIIKRKLMLWVHHIKIMEV